MHVVIGGAYAGKRSYMKKQYPDGTWLRAGAEDIESTSSSLIVYQVESWLRDGEDSDAFWKWMEQLPADKEQVLILEEMGQGIVPVDPLERKIRDENGRIAQQAVQQAEIVDYLWHGLVERWKGSAD